MQIHDNDMKTSLLLPRPLVEKWMRVSRTGTLPARDEPQIGKPNSRSFYLSVIWTTSPHPCESRPRKYGFWQLNLHPRAITLVLNRDGRCFDHTASIKPQKTCKTSPHFRLERWIKKMERSSSDAYSVWSCPTATCNPRISQQMAAEHTVLDINVQQGGKSPEWKHVLEWMMQI